MPCYACSWLQDRMKILVTGCRSARIRKETTSEMRTVIKFIDYISIFADTPEGLQKLLNVVQEFMAWCGMQINVKKTYLLIKDNNKTRREQEPALAIDNQRKNSSSDESR